MKAYKCDSYLVIVYLNKEVWKRFSAGLGKDKISAKVHNSGSSQWQYNFLWEFPMHVSPINKTVVN